MNGIYRVLRMTLHYRLTLLGVILSSMFMSVLWSANITVVYPFVEVVFLGKTMQEWAHEESARLEKEIIEITPADRGIQSRLRERPPRDRALLESQIKLLNSKIELTQRGIDWMARIQPWIDRYVPTDSLPHVARHGRRAARRIAAQGFLPGRQHGAGRAVGAVGRV